MSLHVVSSHPLQTARSHSSWFVPVVLLSLFLFLPVSLLAVPVSAQFLGASQLFQTATTLVAPQDVAVDAQGSVYILDSASNNIMVVNPDAEGLLVSQSGGFSGYGANTYTIDCTGSSLSPALLSGPTAIAVTGAGQIYIADTGNNRIVVANLGTANTDATCSQVSTGSIALNSPQGVAVDEYGDLFISDTNGYADSNGQIVEIYADASVASVLNATTAVSNGVTGLSHPVRIAWGLNSDTLYIADSNNSRIVAWNPSGTPYEVTTNATLIMPTGIAVDSVGNLYISDAFQNQVYELPNDGSQTAVSLETGNEILDGTLANPVGISVDQWGTVYVADTGNSRVLSQVGKQTGGAVNFYNQPLNYGTTEYIPLVFSVPVGTTLGTVTAYTQGSEFLDFSILANNDPFACQPGVTGQVCVVWVGFSPTAPGLRRGAVVLYDNGTTQGQIAEVPLFGIGTAPQMEFLPAGYGAAVSTGSVSTLQPMQIALDGDNNMFVGNYSGNNVVEAPPQGGSGQVIPFSANSGNPNGPPISQVGGVAIDGAGNLFIADHANSQIWVANPHNYYQPQPLTINGLTTILNEPLALNFDPAGNLYIADWGNNRVVEVSSLSGDINNYYGQGTVVNTGSYNFWDNDTGSRTVTGVAVDPWENIYIADSINDTIVVAPQNISQVMASGSGGGLNWPGQYGGGLNVEDLSLPQGVASDGMGNIFIADGGDGRVVAVNFNSGVGETVGSITTTPGPLGKSLFGVTVDPWGNVFVPDYSNNRIAAFYPTIPPNLNFKPTQVGATADDSTQVVGVWNMGDEVLLMPGPDTGLNPSISPNFSLNNAAPGACQQVASAGELSLLPGFLCTLNVNFTPAAAGNITGTVVATNNNLYTHTLGGYTTQTETLSGIGLLDTPASVVVTGAPNSVFLDNPVTYTATVTGINPSYVPTGTVTFTDGTKTLGTAPVNAGGVAALTVTPYKYAGTHNITATYNGDTSTYNPATSAAYAEVVQDFTVAVPNPASATMNPGATATFNLSFSPTNGATFPAPVLLTISGQPSGSTVSLSSTTLASGSSTGSVVLTVTAPALTAKTSAAKPGLGLEGKLAPISIALLLLPFFGIRRVRKSWQRYMMVLILLVGGLAASAGLSGCTSTPSGYFGQGGTTFDYNVTVTGTSGGLTHSTTIAITVN